MRVIINSRAIIENVEDFNANFKSGIILLSMADSSCCYMVETVLNRNNIKYVKFGGKEGHQFEIDCESISAYKLSY